MYNVFLVGASGVGKSTLTEELKQFGFLHYSSSASAIADRYGGWDRIASDPVLNTTVQVAIWDDIITFQSTAGDRTGRHAGDSSG